MQRPTYKPKIRSPLRLMLGRIYYTNKRYIFWLFGGLSFARQDEAIPEYECFSHSTPLLRKLKDVEMYMQYMRKNIFTVRVSGRGIQGIILSVGKNMTYAARWLMMNLSLKIMLL